MTIHDVIVAKLRQLPEPLANQVNDFIDSLMTGIQVDQATGISRVYQVGTAWVVESMPTSDLTAAIDQIREERIQALVTNDGDFV